MLVSAILIIPPATAGLLVHRMPQIMVLSTALAVLASIVGLHASFHGSLSTGPAVVLVSAAIFGLVLVATSLRRAPLETGTPRGLERP